YTTLFRSRSTRPIVFGEALDRDAEAFQIIPQGSNPRGVAIARDQLAAVLHHPGEISGLPAGGRAGIEHFLPGLRIEQQAGGRCARILDVAMAAVECV